MKLILCNKCRIYNYPKTTNGGTGRHVSMNNNYFYVGF